MVSPVALPMRAGLQVQTTYIYSPSLLPKPTDWGPEVSVSAARAAPTNVTSPTKWIHNELCRSQPCRAAAWRLPAVRLQCGGTRW